MAGKAADIMRIVPIQAAYHGEKIKGKALFDCVFPLIFLIARKNSGKSVVIYHLFKHLLTKNERLYVFASTYNKDPVYLQMQRDCEASKREAYFHDDFMEGNVSMLPSLIATLNPGLLSKPYEDGHATPSESPNPCMLFDEPLAPPPLTTRNGHAQQALVVHLNTSAKVRKVKTKKKPRTTIILDDLGEGMRHPSVTQMLKCNRHNRLRVIMSSQAVTDLMPAARKQLDYCLLFKSFNDDKLEQIHKDMDIGIDFNDFKQLYDYATRERYSFLYVDTRHDLFRRNFDTMLQGIARKADF
jgi:hypothetical protein